MWTMQELEAIKRSCESEMDTLLPYLVKILPGMRNEQARAILARVIAKAQIEMEAIAQEEAAKKKAEADEAKKGDGKKAE